MKPFPARLFTYSLFKDEIVPFFVNRTKKEPDKIQMIFTSILRQALVVMITHTPIRSVRTFFLWKLTAMTDLQMGHLILMMPSTNMDKPHALPAYLFASRKRPAKRECQTDRW